jgi:hypothetical protein
MRLLNTVFSQDKHKVLRLRSYVPLRMTSVIAGPTSASAAGARHTVESRYLLYNRKIPQCFRTN